MCSFRVGYHLEVPVLVPVSFQKVLYCTVSLHKGLTVLATVKLSLIVRDFPGS